MPLDLGLVGQFSDPGQRAQVALKLAAWLGVERLVVFLRDPELRVLLPGPGFPQTLGRAWREMAQEALREGEAGARVLSLENRDWDARAYRVDAETALVLLGGEPARDKLSDLLLISPLLGALLRNEMSAQRAEDLVEMAERSAAEADVLARGLDSTRRELQARWRELKKAKQIAEESNSAKSEFVANMSHELRTPIHGILGTLELLTFDPLTDAQRQDLDVINSCCRTLLSIIEDVLDFSRIEARKLDLEAVPFDLYDTARSVWAAHRKTAENRGLEFALRMDPSEQRHVGDPHRLSQILHNLLSNALKFTQTGSVTLSGEVRGDQVVLAVQDTGIGIPAPEVERLFEPFQQVDTSTTRRFGGSGLGLSIARQLVELMGGQLQVVSELGRGSTFRLTLRLPVAETSGEHEQVVSGTVSPLRVLVADDNHINLQMLRRLLERAGHSVVVAENGIQALTAWQRECPDVIFMDLQMPELDGLGAIRQIRAAEALGGSDPVAIIALTAVARAEDRERCLRDGASEYLSKPVFPKQLEEVLARVAG